MTNYQKLINGNLKKLRKKLDLTQESFAEKANMSVEGYRNLEKNRYAPNPETIDKICMAFNITPFELLLPDTNSGSSLLEEIQDKLMLCNNDSLRRISKMIDIIRE